MTGFLPKMVLFRINSKNLLVKVALLAASYFLFSPGRLNICISCASQVSEDSDNNPAAENFSSQADAEEFLNVTPEGNLIFDFSKPFETDPLQQKIAEISNRWIQTKRKSIPMMSHLFTLI